MPTRKGLHELIETLTPLASNGTLLVSAIRFFGLNVWIQLYVLKGEMQIGTFDIILFDTSYKNHDRREIINPTQMHSVASIETTDRGDKARQTIVLRIETNSEIIAYTITFSGIAHYIADKPLHRKET